MKKLHTYINESIFDVDSKKVDNTMYLKTFNNILDKCMSSHTKACIDMFGREIKVGDLCLAYITAEWHFIEVGEIIDDGGWKDTKHQQSVFYRPIIWRRKHSRDRLHQNRKSSGEQSVGNLKQHSDFKTHSRGLWEQSRQILLSHQGNWILRQIQHRHCRRGTSVD